MHWSQREQCFCNVFIILHHYIQSSEDCLRRLEAIVLWENWNRVLVKIILCKCVYILTLSSFSLEASLVLLFTIVLCPVLGENRQFYAICQPQWLLSSKIWDIPFTVKIQATLKCVFASFLTQYVRKPTKFNLSLCHPQWSFLPRRI